MVVPERPAPPRALAGLPEDEQAKILHQEYVRVLAWGADLEKKLTGLIDFIDRLYREEGRDADAH